VPICYDIFPSGTAWRVVSRGFSWDFAQGAQAVDFANDMAEHFARSSGQGTCVRYRDEAGDVHELNHFEGALPWLPPAADPARQAVLLPFRRKGH
jgi:hypothetical protein